MYYLEFYFSRLRKRGIERTQVVFSSQRRNSDIHSVVFLIYHSPLVLRLFTRRACGCNQPFTSIYLIGYYEQFYINWS